MRYCVTRRDAMTRSGWTYADESGFKNYDGRLGLRHTREAFDAVR